MKKFLKSTEIDLVNGGYLAVKGAKELTPVTNAAFIQAQKHAEYIITFAKLAKDKDFKGKKADSLADLESAVRAELSTKDRSYVKKPKKVVKKLSQQLHDEAMAFMSFEKDTTKVEKINAFLQQFNVLAEFEEFGLFFDEGIVKLNTVYTMKEIVAAVESTIDLLK
jgi:hypothetical protein